MRPQQREELTLRDLAQTFHRRRKILYYTVGGFFVLGILYCLIATPRYLSTGVIQVQQQSSDGLGLDNVMAGGPTGGDALTESIDLATQAKILESDNLALNTIHTLNMEGTKDFVPRWNPISSILGLFTPSGAPDPRGASLEDSPHRRRLALKVFSNNLTIKPQAGTRLIDISYKNPDAKLSAAVVNSLATELADYTFQTRYDATQQASHWLANQLTELRKTSNDLQAKVVQLQRESGLYDLGAVDAQGRPQAYSAVLTKLQDSTQTLTAAEQSKILKGAIAHAAESGDAELLSGLAGNGGAPNSPAVNNSLTVIQNLRQQEATQETALREAEAKFGPSYPRLAQMKAGIAGLRQMIKDEVKRLRGRAESDFRVAEETESQTRRDYEQAKKQAAVTNDKSIELAIARQEADQSRTLYEDLLKHLNEAGILQGLRSSNISIVDFARPLDKPTSPNVILIIPASIVLGAFLGLAAILIIDALDDTISHPKDAERMFGDSLLGALPFVKSAKDARSAGPILARDFPHAPYVESLRALRTALDFSSADKQPAVILVTSSVEGEGKTTCAINLAIVFAQSGKRTLLIDGDLRRGSVKGRLGLAAGPGLTDLLTGKVQLPPIQSFAGIPGLSVLPAGTASPNPSDLLNSEAMRAWLTQFGTDFECVILDSAPVLQVTDSVILNGLAGSTVLLARSGKSSKSQAERSYDLLRMKGTHPVGVVLNGLSSDDALQHGYSANGYPYQEDKVANA